MKFFVLFLQFAYVFGAEYVPVLIWESHRSSPKEISPISSLSKLSSDEFLDYFTKKVSGKTGTKPLIAAFVEENLSVEDFSFQEAEGRSTFPHLQNLTSAAPRSEFLPSVHAPLKGLKRLGFRWQNYQAESEDETSLPNEGGVVLVVKLGDAESDESRPVFLKRHDHVISEIYNDLLEKNKDVIAVYTSRHSSWIEPDNETFERRRRSIRATDSDNGTFYADGEVLIHYESSFPTLIIDEGEPIQVQNNLVTNYTRDATNIVLGFKFANNEYTLVYKFAMSESKYWNLTLELRSISGVRTTLTPTIDIYAPHRFSYHCSQMINFTNGTGTVVTFERFQAQAFMDGASSFGDPYDCVWFFTVPIWAGLLITALLGLILAWGLAMIMDIKTMDQFDDPKGKPLTINVSE